MNVTSSTQPHNDSLCGVGSVMEAMDSRVLVFNKARDTRNIARHVKSSQRNIRRESSTGTIGLKSAAMPENAAAQKYLPERAACRTTKVAPAHTTNCNMVR